MMCWRLILYVIWCFILCLLGIYLGTNFNQGYLSCNSEMWRQLQYLLFTDASFFTNDFAYFFSCKPQNSIIVLFSLHQQITEVTFKKFPRHFKYQTPRLQLLSTHFLVPGLFLPAEANAPPSCFSLLPNTHIDIRWLLSGSEDLIQAELSNDTPWGLSEMQLYLMTNDETNWALKPKAISLCILIHQYSFIFTLFQMIWYEELLI